MPAPDRTPHASDGPPRPRPLFAIVYRPGPAWLRGEPVSRQPLAPHAAYVERLLGEGRLVLAGPFLDDAGGLAVIEAESLEEARRVLAEDPALASGVMTGAVHPWLARYDRSRRNVEVVRALYAAVEARDPGGVWRAHADDVVVHETPSLPYGGEYRGAEGVQRHARGYVAAWGALQRGEDRRMDPELVADGDRVAVLWHQRAYDAATGEALHVPVVTVHRLAGGRVVESRMFHFDTVAMRDFLERAERARPR